MFKCICDLKYDWLRLNSVNVFVCCLCMYRMTIGRLEVRIFFIQDNILAIPLPVEIIRPMLILANYGLKHLKRR